jgi:hypothetical protein
MNDVYDNGEIVLGSVYNVKDYICRNCYDVVEVKDLINDLEDLDEDSIVAINYDNGMGYSLDWWANRDKIENRNNEVK